MSIEMYIFPRSIDKGKTGEIFEQFLGNTHDCPRMTNTGIIMKGLEIPRNYCFEWIDILFRDVFPKICSIMNK